MNLKSCLVCAALVVCTGTALHASFESMVQVAQPLHVRSGETAIRICTIPYVGHSLNPRDRGKALRLTTAKNSVWCDERLENRNLASLAGIRFSVELGPDLHGNDRVTTVQETLRVTVEFTSPEQPLAFAIESILQSTLWCGLLNARRMWPDVRFVDYIIESEVHHAQGGRYSLDALPSSSAARWGKGTAQRLEECRVR